LQGAPCFELNSLQAALITVRKFFPCGQNTDWIKEINFVLKNKKRL